MKAQHNQLSNQQIKKRYEKIAPRYDNYAMLPNLMGERLLEKLDFIKLRPMICLELGCGTANLQKPLQKRFPKAKYIGLDLSFHMLTQAQKKEKWFSKTSFIQGNIAALPLASHSVDFIVMNAVLPWLIDLPSIFAEIARVIKPDGLLLFSTVGPDTLKELTRAFSEIGPAHYSFENTCHFRDMHDIADMMLYANWSSPVVDMEKITVYFDSIQALLMDFKYFGAFIFIEHVLKFAQFKRLLRQLEEHYCQDNQGYPATIEIIYGHAWGAVLTKAVFLKQGVAHIPVEILKHKKNNY